jgi:hypothetical protein
MKKLLALTLALAIVLSLSSAAFAAGSPAKWEATTNDLPGTTSATVATVAPGTKNATINIIPNAGLNDDQKATVDKALETVQEDGYLPTDSFMVSSDGEGFILVEAPEDAVIFVIDENGNILKFSVKELEAVGNGKYQVPVGAGVSTVIVAVAK